MILKLNENISDETVDKVVSFYNNTQEKAVIYFSSSGGNYFAMETIVDLINSHKEITTIIGYGLLGSSAFELFFTVECEKRIIGGCNGMYHQSYIAIEMSEKWKPVYVEGKAKEKYLKGYMNQQTTLLCEKLGFTKKEKLEITKGNDLYFQPERMKEFLKR